MGASNSGCKNVDDSASPGAVADDLGDSFR